MAKCTDGNTIYPVTEDSKSERIALLINNIRFQNEKFNRNGAEHDGKAMLKLFHHLGYEVVYYQDLTAEEINHALIHFSKHPKLFNTDSVFVVVMSHGDLGTICGYDLKEFEIDNIFERLNTKNCPALIDKPKVIIIQACRGGTEGVVKISGSIQSMVTDNFSSTSKNNGDMKHLEKDFICFHSSTPHTFSYRLPEYGSYFIHYICDVIFDGYCKDDIEELFRQVMQRFEDHPSKTMQMPTKERDTLTKHFYLFPRIIDLSPGEKHPCKRREAIRVEPAGVRWLRPGLRKYSCQLTIDTNTVHTKLQLSDNNRKVTRVEEVQSYPDHPDRFDVWVQLLCRNGLTGRCYWEVKCRGNVYISVSYRRIRRKGNSKDCWFGCNDQSWSLECSYRRGYSVWHNNRQTLISSSSSSSSVSNRAAVYVDCLAGTLSFYRVSSDTLIHLHTFNTTFTQTLYPGFWFSSGSSVSLC
uniref:Uncharacterized protein n=1 Tax=Oreochromis aureus TaxID=47969 RepID=A0A668SM81_OREAU